jgi:hypothetical protein
VLDDNAKTVSVCGEDTDAFGTDRSPIGTPIETTTYDRFVCIDFAEIWSDENAYQFIIRMMRATPTGRNQSEAHLPRRKKATKKKATKKKAIKKWSGASRIVHHEPEALVHFPDYIDLGDGFTAFRETETLRKSDIAKGIGAMHVKLKGKERISYNKLMRTFSKSELRAAYSALYKTVLEKMSVG